MPVAVNPISLPPAGVLGGEDGFVLDRVKWFHFVWVGKEKWVRLVNSPLGSRMGRRSRWPARLQGSRGGGGEGGVGRAKLLWEKGIGGQMLESTGDAVGTVGFVSDGHTREECGGRRPKLPVMATWGTACHFRGQDI